VECGAYSSGVGSADRTGVVKIIPFLELEPRLNIKYGFNWAGKNEHFSKVSSYSPLSEDSIKKAIDFHQPLCIK
jgi:hypothetical protein